MQRVLWGSSTKPVRHLPWLPPAGYARVLRYYLSSTLSAEEYEALQWVKAGATNLRYQASSAARRQR